MPADSAPYLLVERGVHDEPDLHGPLGAGHSERDRTKSVEDLAAGALEQSGAGGRTRTADPALMRRVL